MKKEKQDSPVIRFLYEAWRSSQKATGHSWQRLNHGMRDALFLTVQMGFEWQAGDYNEAMKRFNGGYWIGAEGFEQLYKTAVLYRNSSAWQSLEAHANRKPFIVKGASSYVHGNMGNGLARLVVGAEFQWNGERVTVTSFNDEKGYLVAQSYSHGKAEICKTCSRVLSSGERKIQKRYQITHPDIKAAKKKVEGPA